MCTFLHVNDMNDPQCVDLWTLSGGHPSRFSNAWGLLNHDATGRDPTSLGEGADTRSLVRAEHPSLEGVEQLRAPLRAAWLAAPAVAALTLPDVVSSGVVVGAGELLRVEVTRWVGAGVREDEGPRDLVARGTD